MFKKKSAAGNLRALKQEAGVIGLRTFLVKPQKLELQITALKRIVVDAARNDLSQLEMRERIERLPKNLGIKPSNDLLQQMAALRKEIRKNLKNKKPASWETFEKLKRL